MLRHFVSLMLCAVVLAACGGATNTAQTPSTAAPAATVAPAPTATAETPDQSEAVTTVVEPTTEPTAAATLEAATTMVSDETATAATTTTVSDETATAAGTTTAGDGVFPVTIEHKFGSTEITQAPTRIVTVGLTEQDALFALGIVPVGVTYWFGEAKDGIGSWARDDFEALGQAAPTVVGDASAVNYESITLLNPDVIIALYAGLTEEQYNLLSQIAPTVAQPGAYVDYGVPWQELTRKVGQIVGKATQAEQLIAGVDARFAEERAAHPEFIGATTVGVSPYQGIAVYSREDPRSRNLLSLGFDIPETFDAIVGDQFYGNVSLEQAQLLDLDVVVWDSTDAAPQPLGGPVYQTLKAHTEGREVFIRESDGPLYEAYSFTSVLSIPFVLDALVPRLVAAMDGDPATISTAGAPVANRDCSQRRYDDASAIGVSSNCDCKQSMIAWLDLCNRLTAPRYRV